VSIQLTPLRAEVFARLPDQFRRKVRTRWAEANLVGYTVDSFLEGPSFDRAGNLYVVDIPFGRIFRISAAADWTLVAEYEGWPNGLKVHKDGRVFLADYRRGILYVEASTGAVSAVVETHHSESFKGCNDLFFAGNGDLFFTDQGQTGLHDPTGRVYRYNANGRLDLLLTTVPSPNGLVMNAAETQLYVAVTRANAIWRLPLMLDGSVSKAGLFIQLSGSSAGPDGLALDADGGIWVCHVGLGVWRFDHLGRPTHLIEADHGSLWTNLAFGGSSNQTLYITDSASGSIMHTEVPFRGKPMYSHADN
jgi:gluconolactonase